jgi:hypothetical protein
MARDSSGVPKGQLWRTSRCAGEDHQGCPEQGADEGGGDCGDRQLESGRGKDFVIERQIESTVARIGRTVGSLPMSWC